MKKIYGWIVLLSMFLTAWGCSDSDTVKGDDTENKTESEGDDGSKNDGDNGDDNDDDSSTGSENGDDKESDDNDQDKDDPTESNSDGDNDNENDDNSVSDDEDNSVQTDEDDTVDDEDTGADDDNDSDSDGEDQSDDATDVEGATDKDEDAEETEDETEEDTDKDIDEEGDPNDENNVEHKAAADGDVDADADQLDEQYFISNDGDDDNGGSSPDDAWATLANIPPNQAVAVHFERGGEWTVSNTVSVGQGSVYTTYGEGPRPIIFVKPDNPEQNPMAVMMLRGDNVIEGIEAQGIARLGIAVSSDNNIVTDCLVNGAIEGEEYGAIEIAFSIRGQHNRIIGNHVRDLSGMSGDSGDVNTSGGAEAFIVNGSYNEVAYNTAVNCWGPNETLNGAEGGCLEIIVGESLEVVENVYFHHNYCERSVGLFEGCAGNFGGGPDPIQFNHAVIKDSYVSYNLAVDAMWLYLLQPVNTDFDNLVFEHNTLIHGPANDDIPQGGAGSFGIFFDQDPIFPHQSCESDADCDEGLRCFEKREGEGQRCHYEGYMQEGNITVRNNLFIVLEGGGTAMIAPPPGPNDFYNNVFSPSKPWGLEGDVIEIADPGLLDNWRLAPDSPVIDIGSPDAWHDWVDFDGNAVPCGGAPDVGVFEYCP